MKCLPFSFVSMQLDSQQTGEVGGGGLKRHSSSHIQTSVQGSPVKYLAPGHDEAQKCQNVIRVGAQEEKKRRDGG